MHKTPIGVFFYNFVIHSLDLGILFFLKHIQSVYVDSVVQRTQRTNFSMDKKWHKNRKFNSANISCKKRYYKWNRI